MAPFTLAVVHQVLRDAGLLTRPGDFPLGTPEELVFTGVSQDSRSVSPGDLFLAWKGTHHDAHEHAAGAAEAGAAAMVGERFLPEVALPQVVVRNGRRAAALVADAFVGSPWRRMFVAGVTGTNGKTTTVTLARELLARRSPAGAIGTLGVRGPDGRTWEGTEGLTTPGPVQLSRWFRELADQEVRAVAMEASSHALDQSRLDGIRFDVAVFTNLTQDHLDYHRTLEAYREAKLHLADLLKPGGVAIVNRDEEAWAPLLEAGEGGGEGGRSPRVFTFGRSPGAHLRATDEARGPEGSRFTLTLRDQDPATVRLPLPGAHNVENALAAAALALESGMALEDVARGLEKVPQIPGRLERVWSEGFTVLVDFAHTPDALDRVTAAAREITPGRLIVVFGAGGDRDRTKRPLMARAVARHADVVVATSDNPRTEDPERILDDVTAGLEPGSFTRILDRREAIHHALDEAREGDTVLLAGKGHERVQLVRGERLPFDEREIVAAWAAGRGRG